jgi:hypothetical protein
VFPTLITTLSIDSYRRQLRSDAINAENAFKLAQKTKDLAALEKEILLNQDQHNKLSALVLNANDKLAEVDSIQAKIDRLRTRLNNNSFQPGESRIMAETDYNRYKLQLDKAQGTSNESSKMVYDYVIEIKKSDLFGWV